MTLSTIALPRSRIGGCVPAGELDRPGAAVAIAEPDQAEQPRVVDDRHLRTVRPGRRRHGDGDALGRVDAEADAERAEERRREARHRRDVGVACDRTGAGLDRLDAVARARQSLHLAAEMERHAELLLAMRLETDDEFSAVAMLVGRGVDAADQRLPDRRQRRLDRNAARRVDRLEHQPVRLQQTDSATFLSIASRRV